MKNLKTRLTRSMMQSARPNNKILHPMGGVDKHDQLRQYYNVERKSIKWWHRIAFGLLDMAVVNAFLMYQEIGHDSISL